MAGQLPSKGKKIVIDDFQGVVQTYDETLLPDGVVGWQCGLIDERGNLKRLGGKLPLLNTSTSNCKAIYSMEQLIFASTSYLVIHHPGSRELVEDYDAFVETSDGIDEFGI